MTGTLYGVGLGPGAPDLLTLRAARLVERARVVAYPTLAGAPSFARSIVADLLPGGIPEIVIDLPMRAGDRAPAQAAYDAGADRIAQELAAGRDVVCLCEGDPFLYGSFMYLHARLAPRFPVEIVPGITSVTAAAASAAQPLAARNEVFTVLPAPLPEERLAEEIDASDALAILKLGRHMPKIRALLEARGLTAKATYVERATLGEERICPLADAPDSAPYFSMILVLKGADPWL
ncbi:precorrin-2 C(20)-methyltransferase [Histidinibacterium aquaticum]|uniref:Precorrin-2 C(20)-methyltransferase n=1 Tax=Histidinibacterium aquaticum TaxID=2613962 RepID=A0A5J5GH36_9RHOB|nr:precorrin-2 C(20)-methyltransferase [Histidinibacterium aquaticum]KAA9007053.1 precorrin-2 C(20)-methyltransferase [Histidinibacterium aquaticum]